MPQSSLPRKQNTRFDTFSTETLTSIRSKVPGHGIGKRPSVGEVDYTFQATRALCLFALAFGMVRISMALSVSGIPMIWTANGVHIAAILVSDIKIAPFVSLGFIAIVFAGLLDYSQVGSNEGSMVTAIETSLIHALESIMLAVVLFAATIMKKNLSESRALFSFIFSSALVQLVFSICRSLLFTLSGGAPNQFNLGQRVLFDWSAGFPGLIIVVPMFSHLGKSELETLRTLLNDRNHSICVIVPIIGSCASILLAWGLQILIGDSAPFLFAYISFFLVYISGYYGGTFGLCFTSACSLTANLGFNFIWQKSQVTAVATINLGHLPILHIHSILQITGLIFAFLVLKKDKKYAKALKKFETKTKGLMSELEQHRNDAGATKKNLNTKDAYIPYLCEQFHGPLLNILTVWETEQEQLSSVSPEFKNSMQASFGVMLSLVDDVLSYSQLEKGLFQLRPTQTDLRQVIHSTLSIVSDMFRQNSIAFEHQLNNVPSLVVIDPLRFEQVLLNVLVTAVQYTRQGDRMVLKITGTRSTSDNIIQLETIVLFGGQGIFPPLDMLFRPYNMIRKESVADSGLAMASAKKIIELMGGSMNSSRLQSGMSQITFTVSVQVANNLSMGRHNISLNRPPTVSSTRESRNSRTGGTESNSDDSIESKRSGKSITAPRKMSDLYKSVTSLMHKAGSKQQNQSGFSRASSQDKMDPIGITSPSPITVAVGAAAWSKKGRQASFGTHSPASSLRSIDSIIKAEGLRTSKTKASEISKSTISVAQIQPVIGNMLVVDDSSIFRQLLKKTLSMIDKTANIHEASNGAEAISICQRTPMDIIFMDLEMPKMNGDEAISKLRNREILCPIIVISSQSLSSDGLRILTQTGMTHFVQKPISKDLMQGILKQYYIPRRTKTLRMNSPDRPEQILEDVSVIINRISSTTSIANTPQGILSPAPTLGTHFPTSRLSVMSTPEAMFRQPPTRRQTSGSAAGGSDKGSSLDRPSRSITPENASGNIGGTVVTPPEPTERPVSQPISHSFYPENATTLPFFRSQASAHGMQRGPFETGTLPNPTEKYAALVVDDSLVNKAILVRMLEKFGKFNEILEVSSGAEAVKMCQTRKVSIVFMDLEMPGMNGEEAAARIRAAGNTMPIVAVTGNTIRGDDAGPLRHVGIVEIVKKPVEMAKIFELCKSLIQFKNVDNSANLTVTTSSSGPNSTMRLNHGASGLMVNHAPGYGTMKRMANVSTSVMAERDSRGGQ